MRHGGGWGIGFKVAKWVEAGTGNGVRGKGGANAPASGDERRAQIREKAERGERLSAREFGFMAGVDKNRITRYLCGWNAAAKAGLVPHSSEILPDTEWVPDVGTPIGPAIGRGARSGPVPIPRMRLAGVYGTVEELSNALETFDSWF